MQHILTQQLMRLMVLLTYFLLTMVKSQVKMGNPWRCTGFDGNQTPDSIERLEIDWNKGDNSDEDGVHVDDSYSEDEESNDAFNDAQI